MLNCWGGILAGGKSSRFGHNKALQQVDGVLFLQRAINMLLPVCDRVVISASEANAQDYFQLEADILKDEQKDLGPLEGIATLLKHCTADRMLITTCDMPLLTTSTLQQMIDAPTHELICWQDHEDRMLPFPMLIDTRCVSRVERLLEERRLRVRSLLDLCDTSLLTIDANHEKEFNNINTQSDLNQLL